MKKIAIHSAPRSGSTWLGCIFDSNPFVKYCYQPLFSYALKGFLTDSSSLENIDSFFGTLLQSNDGFLLQKEAKQKGKIPIFPKREKPSHIVYKEVRYHHVLENLLEKDRTVKVIGLVRNPLNVINSWLKAPREFRKDLGWNEMDEWRFAPSKNQNKIEEYNGFEKWKEVTLLFEKLQKKYPDQFYLLQYELINQHPIKATVDLFKFCDLPMTEATHTFLNKSQAKTNKDAYSVFKQKNNDKKWKQELNPLIAQSIIRETENAGLSKFLS